MLWLLVKGVKVHARRLGADCLSTTAINCVMWAYAGVIVRWLMQEVHQTSAGKGLQREGQDEEHQADDGQPDARS